MNKDQATAASHRLAESLGARLGERTYGSGEIDPTDQNAPYWTLVFSAPDCPPGWEWWVRVNETGENQMLVAMNRSVPIRIQPPCPYCGKPLKTDRARQCLSCGMEWH